MIYAVIVVSIALAGQFALHGNGNGQAQASAAGRSVSFLADKSFSERRHMAQDISFHPEKILQVTGADIQSVLREPELIRRDGPTTIWQYRTDACVLDIYFSGKDPLVSGVAHYEMRARGKGGQAAGKASPDCPRSLVRSGSRAQMIGVSALYKAMTR